MLACQWIWSPHGQFCKLKCLFSVSLGLCIDYWNVWVVPNQFPRSCVLWEPNPLSMYHRKSIPKANKTWDCNHFSKRNVIYEALKSLLCYLIAFSGWIFLAKVKALLWRNKSWKLPSEIELGDHVSLETPAVQKTNFPTKSDTANHALSFWNNFHQKSPQLSWTILFYYFAQWK